MIEKRKSKLNNILNCPVDKAFHVLKLAGGGELIEENEMNKAYIRLTTVIETIDYTWYSFRLAELILVFIQSIFLLNSTVNFNQSPNFRSVSLNPRQFRAILSILLLLLCIQSTHMEHGSHLTCIHRELLLEYLLYDYYYCY